ncbi:protein ABHD11 [Selaginella moellendorffii]|nr:protein ABHD11 [Selaginella moellendorffii]|eukprot:XP_002983041.2 protein ABHD11 [Selaginella moellendorffii]
MQSINQRIVLWSVLGSKRVEPFCQHQTSCGGDKAWSASPLVSEGACSNSLKLQETGAGAGADTGPGPGSGSGADAEPEHPLHFLRMDTMMAMFGGTLPQEFQRPLGPRSSVLGCSHSKAKILQSSTLRTRVCYRIQMTIATQDEVILSRPKISPILAYDLVQGPLVRWSEARDKATPEPPTAVFLHGILGCRKNWASFARRLAKEFPAWQFLLVDLRCHGDSSLMPGSHTVSSSALDVLKLLGKLRLTPRILVGHSFGGKVVLSMIDQAAKPLARPVQAWILDATPGEIRAGGGGEDHPAELIEALRRLPAQVPSRRVVLNSLTDFGFSEEIAKWMTTNLKPARDSSDLFWTFDLNGISDMYRSYEDTNLWNLVDNVPEGVHLNFLRAERSLHRWAHEDIQRIDDAEASASNEGAGVDLHVLEDSGHWVHADNPDGLFRTLTPSFNTIQ